MADNVESPHQITESEYLFQLNHFAAEVDNANVIYQTYEEINCASVTDQAVRSALDKHAIFWNVQVYSLRTSLMMVLGRIFDTDGDALSVHKILNTTIASVSIFSKDSLQKRKLDARITGKNLENFIGGAWAPCSSSDLRHLKKALAEHAVRYKNTYGPIRDKFFAHRIIKNPNDVWKLFAGTDRIEIGETIAFLIDLVQVLQNLYHNGTEPVLGGQRIGSHNRRIRDDVKAVLAMVAAKK